MGEIDTSDAEDVGSPEPEESSDSSSSSSSSGRLVRPAAWFLVAVGVLVALGATWQWLGKIRHVADQQQRLESVLERRWATSPEPPHATRAPHATAQAGRPPRQAAAMRKSSTALRAQDEPGPVPPGTPIARIHLPTLGLSLVVVEGAGRMQLRQGPGRVLSSRRLGEPGNAAIVGHRYPGVFWDLDRLVVGDPVVLETRHSWLVFRVTRTVVVEPHDDSVFSAPASGRPPLLTLITNEPKLSTAHRLVKQAELVRSDPHAGPKPRELSRRSRR